MRRSERPYVPRSCLGSGLCRSPPFYVCVCDPHADDRDSEGSAVLKCVAFRECARKIDGSMSSVYVGDGEVAVLSRPQTADIFKEPAVPPSSKLALMFLVRETLNQPKAWEAFLRGHEEQYEVYCHPKEKEKVTVPLLCKGIIEENVPTKWGDISVTKAIIALLRAALKDGNNQKFCLFSESCVPLARSFSEVREEVLSHNKSYFDFMNLSDYRRRYEELKQPNTRPNHYNGSSSHRGGKSKGKGKGGGKSSGKEENVWIPEIHFKKHATWFVIDRKHAEIILKQHKRYLNLFNKVTVPDEHFFATVLCNEGHVSDLIPKQTTFTDWDANNFWFEKKLCFYMKWGLHIEKAGEQLPSKITGSQLIGKLPKQALKEWNEIQQLDSKMWSDDLVAHPRTFKTVTHDDLGRMRQSMAYFARKCSPESNFSTTYMMDVVATQVPPSITPTLNMVTRRYDVPAYLHSQLFSDMQAMVAYIDSTIRESDVRHSREKDSMNAAYANGLKTALSQERDAVLQGFEANLGLLSSAEACVEEGGDNGEDNGVEEDQDGGLLLCPGALLGFGTASEGEHDDADSGDEANAEYTSYREADEDYLGFSSADDDSDGEVVMNFDVEED